MQTRILLTLLVAAIVLVMAGYVLSWNSRQTSVVPSRTTSSSHVTRLTGWDISLELPREWTLRPASDDRRTDVARSDDWVFFESTTSTIYPGAAQAPEGEYITTDYGFVSIKRLDAEPALTAPTRIVLGDHAFVYQPAAIDEAGPDPESGYYYQSLLHPGRWYQLQIVTLGVVQLDPETILRSLREEP